jgi:LysR family glycine cleavage system transcriptional activator
MTARTLPSLNALRAFEAAARHQSFTLAAQELHVTQGAVSHQVKALEEELGVPLFERLSNQLRLTAAGQRYLVAVGEAFDRIESGTRQLLERPQREHLTRLTISTSPNFNAKWLAPRLGGFSARHADLDLRVEQSERQVNFLRENIDLAIRYGDGPWSGLSCTRLGDEFLLPVCAPALDVDSIVALSTAPLLHSHDRQSWRDWFALHGLSLDERPGIVFNQESAAVDAALAGQGVALARSSLVVRELQQGRLVAPVSLSLPLAQAYWLVYPQEGETDGNIAAFSNWLLQECEADRQFWNSVIG